MTVGVLRSSLATLNDVVIVLDISGLGNGRVVGGGGGGAAAATAV